MVAYPANNLFLAKSAFEPSYCTQLHTYSGCFQSVVDLMLRRTDHEQAHRASSGSLQDTLTCFGLYMGSGMHDLELDGERGCIHLLACICALASACLLCNTESRQSACLLTVLPAGRCLPSAYVTTLQGNTHTLLRLWLITA